jgi:hypothetical protein
MTLPARSLRLQKYSAVQLDRMSYEDGEVFYDNVNNTLRLMDGQNPGGQQFAMREWVNTNLTSILSGYATLTYTNNQLALKASLTGATFTGTVNAPTFAGNLTGNVTGNVSGNLTGNVTGNVSGNVTGNVTGNLYGNADTVTNGVYTNQTYSDPSWIGTLAGSKITGNITGNAGTATALQTARTINNVSFSGTANITVPTLVNGSYSVSLGSDGVVTVPSTVGISTTGSIKSESTNIVVESVAGNVTVRTNTNKNWIFSSAGNLTAPGDITTTTGTITSSNTTVTNTMTAGSAAVTNDVTVGANVNIATIPTQIQHATNKNYVDTRSLAMSIALS